MLGGPLKPPGSQESEAERKICDEMRQIVNSLPKLDYGFSGEKVDQYGNNFFTLFQDLENKEKDPKLVREHSMLDRVEKDYPKEWEQFLRDNADLIIRVQAAIRDMEQGYGRLVSLVVQLVFDHKNSSLAETISKELNLDGIRNRYLRSFNEILMQAAEKMRSCGIPPGRYFYGDTVWQSGPESP